jgi:hypothetical protein
VLRRRFKREPSPTPPWRPPPSPRAIVEGELEAGETDQVVERMTRSKKERVWTPPPTPRELVVARLEPGEPIEALIKVASTGPGTNRVVGTAAGVATVATLGTSMIALQTLQHTVALAVTDRRVFFVRDASATGMRIEPKAAVRVLEYERVGPSLNLWLNVDGHQVGYHVGASLQAATDAFVHSLGGAPPSRKTTEDR